MKDTRFIYRNLPNSIKDISGDATLASTIPLCTRDCTNVFKSKSGKVFPKTNIVDEPLIPLNLIKQKGRLQITDHKEKYTKNSIEICKTSQSSNATKRNHKLKTMTKNCETKLRSPIVMEESISKKPISRKLNVIVPEKNKEPFIEVYKLKQKFTRNLDDRELIQGSQNKFSSTIDTIRSIPIKKAQGDKLDTDISPHPSFVYNMPIITERKEQIDKKNTLNFYKKKIAEVETARSLESETNEELKKCLYLLKERKKQLDYVQNEQNLEKQEIKIILENEINDEIRRKKLRAFIYKNGLELRRSFESNL